MKKLFVSCMIAFMAICSVGAQEVYIGGGFTVGSEDSEFVFQISPEVGCHLTDQWAVGGWFPVGIASGTFFESDGTYIFCH